MKLIQSGSTDPLHFWGEVAPCDHLVQIYDDEAIFLDALERFAADGIEAGDGVVVIATEAHRRALEKRLQARGVDIAAVSAVNQLVALDAAETLTRFMVNDWPDESRFEATVVDLLKRAQGEGRRVRAFGEMVALLWARGQCAATVRLEHLWHRFCEKERFSLLCAYPRSGFTRDAGDSIRQICDAHSHVVESTGFVPRSVNSLRELSSRINSQDSLG